MLFGTGMGTRTGMNWLTSFDLGERRRERVLLLMLVLPVVGWTASCLRLLLRSMWEAAADAASGGEEA